MSESGYGKVVEKRASHKANWPRILPHVLQSGIGSNAYDFELKTSSIQSISRVPSTSKQHDEIRPSQRTTIAFSLSKRQGLSGCDFSGGQLGQPRYLACFALDQTSRLLAEFQKLPLKIVQETSDVLRNALLLAHDLQDFAESREGAARGYFLAR
jgi:hypothetical protein